MKLKFFLICTLLSLASIALAHDEIFKIESCRVNGKIFRKSQSSLSSDTYRLHAKGRILTKGDRLYVRLNLFGYVKGRTFQDSGKQKNLLVHVPLKNLSQTPEMISGRVSEKVIFGTKVRGVDINRGEDKTVSIYDGADEMSCTIRCIETSSKDGSYLNAPQC